MNTFIVIAILVPICVTLSLVRHFVQKQPLTSEQRHLQQVYQRIYVLIGLLGFLIYILARNGWNGMNSLLLVSMYVVFAVNTIRNLYKTGSPG